LEVLIADERNALSHSCCFGFSGEFIPIVIDTSDFSQSQLKNWIAPFRPPSEAFRRHK
jgi:hypothetical protein